MRDNSFFLLPASLEAAEITGKEQCGPGAFQVIYFRVFSANPAGSVRDNSFFLSLASLETQRLQKEEKDPEVRSLKTES